MMNCKLVTARIALTLGISLFVLACTDDAQDAQVDAGETDATGEGDGTGEEDAPGDGDGDGDGDSGDGDGDSGDGDGDSGDGDGDGGDETTGDGDGEIEVDPAKVAAACADACEVVGSCVAEVPNCTQECIAAHLALEGECYVAQLWLSECVGGLSCEELEAYMAGGQFNDYPCGFEDALVDGCEG